MTQSIAWSRPYVAKRMDDGAPLLAKRFQLLLYVNSSKLLGKVISYGTDRDIIEGAVGSELSNLWSLKEYAKMTLTRARNFASTDRIIVLIENQKELAKVEPYLGFVVEQFINTLD